MMAATDDEDVLFDRDAYSDARNNISGGPVMSIEDEEEDTIFDQARLLPNHIRRGGEIGSNKCVHIWTTGLLFFAFFGLGLCIALPGPTLLDLQERTNTDTEGISRIFIGRSAGYLIGSIIGGLLIDRLNKSFLMSLFLALMAIATAIIPWFTKLYLLIITFAFQGVFMGFVDTAVNLMCVQTWGRKSPPYMQALHFFFGLGAFVSPLIAEPFLSINSTVVFLPNASAIDGLVVTGGVHVVPTENTLALSGRDLRHLRPYKLFRRSISDKILANSVHDLNSSLSTFSNLSVTLALTTQMPTTSKPKKPAIADGKFLKSDPKVADGKNLKVLHDINHGLAPPGLNPTDDSDHNPSTEPKKEPPQMAGISVHQVEKSDQKTLSESKEGSSDTGLPDLNRVGNSNQNKLPKSKAGATVKEELEVVPPADKPEPILLKRTDVKPTSPTHLSTTGRVVPTSNANVSTVHPTKKEPKPKKPNTDGAILSPDKNVASGKNVPKKLVDKVQKQAKIVVTKPVLPPTKTVKNATLESNATSSNNSIANHVNKTVPSIPTSTLETTSTTLITTTRFIPSTKGTTKAAPTVNNFKPLSTPQGTREQTSKNSETSDKSDLYIHKPTATVMNSSEDDRFTTHIKTQVTKMWHYFTNTVTKVQFLYLIVSIFLIVEAMMFCAVCCYDCRRKTPAVRNLNQYHMPQRDGVGFKVQIIVLLFLLNFFYVGMEITFSGFVMSFAVDYLKWEKSAGSYVNALFWGSFALTRLLSIPLAKCLRPTVMLIIDLVITCVSLLALLFAVNTNDISMWICTALLGIGMASFFPTVLSWAERYINLTGKITAVLIVGAGLGGMAMPTLTGFLFETKSPMFLIYLLFASSLFSCILYIILQNLASNRGEKYSLLASIPLDDDVDDMEMDNLDFTKVNSAANHNHVGRNGTGRTAKKVTFNLEDDVQLLQDSSASGENEEPAWKPIQNL